MKKKTVIIIGGGAAGFFCAANVNENFFQVKILEQSTGVLQKVKISGGGRCNVTHACFDPRELVQFYPRGHKELRSVFHRFQCGDTMEWFEQRGVPLKIEKDNRIFPESNSSQTIINTLVQEVTLKKIEIVTQCTVSGIRREDSQFLISTSKGELQADFVVFATGSSPKSLAIPKSFGHTIIPAVPSLFTFNIKNDLLKDLMGTTFAQAEVSVPTLKIQESGPMLITHWGLSGPAILKMSAWKAREFAQLNYKFDIVVNFLGIPFDAAEGEMKAYRAKHPKKTIGSAKIFDVTARFWQRVLTTVNISTEKNMASLTGREISGILTALCRCIMSVSGKSTHKDEFVTAGGVSLKEINFKNMSSRLVENFYLAGEVLDIDAVTGGFNFQACWSEAWLIAQDLNANALTNDA